MAIPYNPPKIFSTSNSRAFINAKGSGMVGAPQTNRELDILGGLRMPEGMGKTSRSQDRIGKFHKMGNSSYQATFQNFGQLPPPNIKPRAQFAKGWAKFVGQSEAM